MSGLRCTLLLLLGALAALGAALDVAFSPEESGRRLLVLLDEADEKRAYSAYFDGLRERGFALTFKAAADESLQLSAYGEYLFDGVLVLAPRANALGGALDAAQLLRFADAGRALLVAADARGGGELVRALAAHAGLALGAPVRDYAARALAADAALVRADAAFRPANAALVFGDAALRAAAAAGDAAAPLFRGSALGVPPASTLLAPLVRARATAYAALADEPAAAGDALRGGRALVLVAALAARNGARLTFSGSAELFGDELLSRAGASDAVLAQLVGLTEWTLGERGVLRARNIEHRPVGAKVGQGNDTNYRVGQEIEYSVTVEEWSGAQRQWVPFVVDDMQLEFTMLDPHVRQFLRHVGNGKYTLQFKLPDVYGVFTFRTVYARPGYTALITETRMPVRPLRHDEYERFIDSAAPYYISALSMAIGLFVFAIVFLYHRDESSAAKKKN